MYHFYDFAPNAQIIRPGLGLIYKSDPVLETTAEGKRKERERKG